MANWTSTAEHGGEFHGFPICLLDPKLVAKQPGNANGSEKRALNDSLLSVSKEHRKGHPSKTENLKTALVQPYPHLTPTHSRKGQVEI